jgi:hypothetical protein
MGDTDPIMSVSAHDKPPTAAGVPVGTEWALWGKDARDAEYRLLACSDGPVSAATFIEQITCFSPGSAETWPQVTVSGFLLDGAADYVALAIHDTSEGRHDAVGRGIVYTRYFCVPYPELAAGRVSYGDMYKAFADFWPDGRDRSAKRFVLSCADRLPSSTALPGVQRLLAMRVASLLLTGRGVCVLGADGADASERLAFLDDVMSLLPYGMRSRFAGATWASSTAYDLKLRLFFADARGRGNDHEVFWHQPEYGPIDHSFADQYLRWLTAGTPEPETRLAAVTEPMGFGQAEVAMMLERLDVSYAKPPSAPVAVGAPGPAASVAAVLRECGGRLRGGNPNFINTELDKLRQCLAFPTSPAMRAYFQQVIADEGLFQPRRSIEKHLLDDLYRLLLQLAFEVPLTYYGYCEVEACLGQQPHKQLVQAMQPAWLPDLRARMLAVKALGGRELKRMRSELRTMPVPLVAAVADTDVRADHARLLCDLAVPPLCECLDPLALRQSLQVHAYLAPTLLRLYPGESQPQYERLRRLLRAAHRGRLDRRDVPAILALPGQMPSVALFAAVAELADPADLSVAVYEFLANTIDTAKFNESTREWLLRTLPVPAGDDQNLGHPRSRKRIRRAGSRLAGLFRLTPDWRQNEPGPK